MAGEQQSLDVLRRVPFTLRAYEHGPTAMNTPDGRIPGRECCFQRAVDVVPYGGQSARAPFAFRQSASFRATAAGAGIICGFSLAVSSELRVTMILISPSV